MPPGMSLLSYVASQVLLILTALCATRLTGELHAYGKLAPLHVKFSIAGQHGLHHGHMQAAAAQ